MKQNEVASNLDYLIQKGWVVEVVETRTFETTRGTTMPSNKVTYKISDVGIDKLEAASTYRRSREDAGIRITNVRGVTVIGDGNIVNTTYADLSRSLDLLRDAVMNASELEDGTKLDVVSDIDSLQAQLQKPDPDQAVIKRVWNGIEKTVTAAGFVELASKVTALIGPLIS